MGLGKTTYGDFVYLTGTAEEVLNCLTDEQIPKHKIISIASNGTSAFYSLKGG